MAAPASTSISAQRTIVGGPGACPERDLGQRHGHPDPDRRDRHRGPEQLHRPERGRRGSHLQRATGISINGQRRRATRSAARRPATGNVISGNTGIGINIQTGSNGTIIQGNLIGLDAGGTLDLGNTGDGINLNGVTGTTVGGAAAGARNVISGNNNVGIRIQGPRDRQHRARQLHRRQRRGRRGGRQHERRHHHSDAAPRATRLAALQPARATSFRATPATASPCRRPRTGTRSRGT